jgi:hypothetical protein
MLPHPALSTSINQNCTSSLNPPFAAMATRKEYAGECPAATRRPFRSPIKGEGVPALTRLFLLVLLVDAQFLQLAGEGVAADAEQVRGFDAAAAGVVEGF